MPVPVSARKAHRKWDALNRDRYWQCPIRFPSTDREAVTARAAELGLPVSEYIRNLVYADLSKQP